MKTTLPWILALTALAAPGLALDRWDAELSGARQIVESTLGDVPLERVEVRRRGRSVEVSIPLDALSSRVFPRTEGAIDEEEDPIFLASNFVQPFLDEGAFAEVTLMPNNAHLIDHYFGFWIFNFGKQVKLPMEIAVFGEDGEQEKIRKKKKKFKVRRKSLTLTFVEGQVSAPGFYALHTTVGPQSLTTYFCNACQP